MIEIGGNRDVQIIMDRDPFGRWVWTVACYSVGYLTALTLTEDEAEARRHCRANLERLGRAFTELAGRV